MTGESSRGPVGLGQRESHQRDERFDVSLLGDGSRVLSEDVAQEPVVTTPGHGPVPDGFVK